MRVAIVVPDNVVFVDGNWAIVDCSDLHELGLHAIQWYDSFGEEEFVTVVDQERKALTRRPNNPLVNMHFYQSYIDQWEVEYAKRTAEEARSKKELEDAVIKSKEAHEAFEKRLREQPMNDNGV